MVNTVQKSNTVAFPTPKPAAGEKRVIVAPQDAQLRLQLSNALQTTLEIPQVLQMFFEEVQNSLSIDSLNYQNDKLPHPTDLGKNARHSCHYKLVTTQDSLGEISFTRSKRFSESELEMLEMMIGCLICPLRNALTYRDAVQSALRDPLTGAGNRMALENTLEREVALALRHSHPLSMLVVDIDKFKSINDTYGHAAGDYVLKDVARMLAHCSRDTDSAYRAYRFGGEEFVVLLSNTTTAGSMIVAERIRESIQDMTTTSDDASINVTVSIGVSSLLKGDSSSELFGRADKALYHAKRNGRNQVVNSQLLLEPNEAI